MGGRKGTGEPAAESRSHEAEARLLQHPGRLLPEPSGHTTGGDETSGERCAERRFQAFQVRGAEQTHVVERTLPSVSSTQFSYELT